MVSEMLSNLRKTGICDGCDYNVDDYCIMFDDVLGFEDCVFRSVDDE